MSTGEDSVTIRHADLGGFVENRSPKKRFATVPTEIYLPITNSDPVKPSGQSDQKCWGQHFGFDEGHRGFFVF